MALVKVKSSVKGKNLTIMAAIANVAQDISFDLPKDIVITSGNDSKHMPTSKHYSNAALDVRSKTFPSKKAKIEFLQAVLKRLGGNYQGFLEDEGKPNEHFHIEWDPPQK